LAQVGVVPDAEDGAKYRRRDQRREKRLPAQRFQKRQANPAYQAEDDQHFDHTLQYRPVSVSVPVSVGNKTRASESVRHVFALERAATSGSDTETFPNGRPRRGTLSSRLWFL
jgi:hypothetical protein